MATAKITIEYIQNDDHLNAIIDAINDLAYVSNVKVEG